METNVYRERRTEQEVTTIMINGHESGDGGENLEI